ncbi:MAG: glutathione S-transferase family protein [Halioglobus sp.]|nr:glutathione S-transferase family protein [Halioglobus sp.]
MTELAGYQADVLLPFEQEYELYHNALSLCSMKTRLCLAELGVNYNSHHIDLIETGCYENIRAPFKAVNPACTVPVLVHNGHPVYESHEQIRYAARHAPADAPQLVPDDPRLQAQMEHWVDLASLSGDPIRDANRSAGNAIPGQTLPLFTTMIEQIPFRNIFEGFVRHFDKRRPLMFTLMKLLGMHALVKVKPLHAALQNSRQQLHRHLDALDAQLQQSGGPWILGATYTLADVSWLVIFERLRQADSLQAFCNSTRHPACRDYWDRLRGRPAYSAAIIEHSHPLIDYGTRRIREIKAGDEEMRRLLEGV